MNICKSSASPTEECLAYPDLQPFKAFVENRKNVMHSILAQAEELVVNC